ncbi:MAG TPA: diguanylate cyclase [Kineosporiaceae bacterium]
MDGELLHEGERARVTRVALVGSDGVPLTAIRKQPLGPDAGRRLRHERAILRRLAGVPGVPHLVSSSDRGGLLLEDCGGQPLAVRLGEGALGPGPLADLASQLAGILAMVHRRGVVHRDINPSNVIMYGDPPRPCLIDFDAAGTVSQDRTTATHQQEWTGTGQYLAPEQTGRTGWPVDSRADLYALGVTLYQAATGVLPFDDSDPLQLIHAHLTQVPTPACSLNPDVSVPLSDILAHLLEKEPGRRYQSAEGLLHDLHGIRRAPARQVGPFRPGAHDFASRLTPGPQLVGRSTQIRALHDALGAAIEGRCRAVFISGAPGVGKTALVDELRPLVTTAGGWLIRGTSDQFRPGRDSSSVRHALRDLGRLLLAEPETRLSPVRARILTALGRRAGVLAAVLPEFQAVLGVPASSEDTHPTHAPPLLRRVKFDLLRAVVQPDRPLVLVLDDLQWAGQAPLDLVDDLLGDDGPAGLLLVGTYRHGEVDAAHPLSVLLARWRRGPSPPVEVHLANLPPADLAEMIGGMIRQPPGDVGTLVDAVRRHTDGNPFATVEFLNMLRHEGVLQLADDGWTWDTDGLDRPIGQGDILSLFAARLAALPQPTRDALGLMACLGTEVELELLAIGLSELGQGLAGTGRPELALDGILAPALEKGLLVIAPEANASAVRFRHDRIQRAAFGSLTPAARDALRLRLARRLAALPERTMTAAEQYLDVISAVTDVAERRAVAPLLQEAAHQARQLGDAVLVERLLAAATDLLDTLPELTAADERLRFSIAADRHAALFALARFEEMDQLYAALAPPEADPVRRADLACVQIRSLTNRELAAEALALGMETLAALGHPAPGTADLAAAIERGLDAIVAWVGSGSEADDVRRGTNQDPRLAAVARVINRTIPAAFFAGAAVTPWLITEAAQVWAQGGPAPWLVGPLMRSTFATIARREDYRTGYLAARRALTAAQALGYDVEYERYLFSLAAGPWFAPLETSIDEARRAREDLLRTGRANDASYTFFVSVCYLLECTPTLQELLDEVQSGLALTERTGNDHVAAVLTPYRQAVLALQGRTGTPGGFDDDSFEERRHLEALSTNPTAAAHFHSVRALTAAVFGDQASLLHHAGAATSLIHTARPTQVSTRAHLLQALALARSMEAAGTDDGLLASFDRHLEWVCRRAADAPANFLHLRYWLEAERAWFAQDFARADQTFDRAQREAASRRRPWQQALIAERRAAFHLGHGMEHAARLALGEAHQAYQEWGASGKVAQLGADHPYLRTGTSAQRAGAGTTRMSGISADAIDMLAVLRASQALSSETTLDRLQARLVDVVGALTGATEVRLLLRDPDAEGWVLSWGEPGSDGGEAVGGEVEHPAAVELSLEEAAAAGLLPGSAVRYVQRTGTPLLVQDATRDDRFASDPFLQGLEACSLLVTPILSRGVPSAMLILLNRHACGAFSIDRQDIVHLLAGQLSVTLENARLYAALERKVAERTQALTAANQQLEQLAVTDPLTGLANRRRFTQALAVEWRRCLHAADPIAVAMIDVDQFKQYNDHYGHPAGDRCLVTVAGTIRNSIRGSDLVARYGGEEFCVILPRTGRNTAATIAERIRAAVADLDEPHERATHGRVTVSIGVATLVPGPGSSPEQLLLQADLSLYRAKHTGRNQVATPVLP